MLKKLFIALMLALFSVGIASADCWVENSYDLRTYHASYPRSDLVNNPGGWLIGWACNADDTGYVIIETSEPTTAGSTHSITFDNPNIYPWINMTLYDYTMRYGHRDLFGTSLEVKVFNKGGDQTVSRTITPSTTHAKPPVCEIKKLAIMKTGELKVKFTAPYDERRSQIRIRVFSTEGIGAVKEFRYDPPYEVIKGNGDSKPDMMDVLIPAEYSGHTARIEYRVHEAHYVYMSRGITYFKLPELE